MVTKSPSSLSKFALLPFAPTICQVYIFKYEGNPMRHKLSSLYFTDGDVEAQRGEYSAQGHIA